MVASMCVFNAFGMRFGLEFQPSWADLEQAALAYIHNGTSTWNYILIQSNSKRFIHILPTDMFFD